MYNWKLAILLAVATVLAGCQQRYSTEVDLPPTKELPKSHVEWPSPLSPCSTDLKVESRRFDSGVEGAVVVIPYKDYLNVQNCNAAKTRFTSSLIGMVCFYRQDLAEKRCEVYYPPKKD